jgi:hypothetical protein
MRTKLQEIKNTIKIGQLKIKTKNKSTFEQCFHRCRSNSLRHGCHNLFKNLTTI